ncbi:hypothetical protein D3C86_1173610 [compost metagenome]
MCAKFGSSSTTSMQRVVNGPLLRSSSKRGMSTSATRGDNVGGNPLGAAATGTARIGSTGTSPGSTYCCGKTRVNTLPCPGVLLTLMEPPSKAARSREIDNPSPVPP